MIERLRVTPVSRLALPLGLVLRDILVLLVQSLLIVLIAIPLGAHINGGGLLLSLVLVVLLGLCLASCSYALALALKDANALSSVLTTLSVPVVLLSGITLPLTLAPPVLRAIADLNPFAYAVNAARDLFLGNLSDAAVPEGFVIIGLLALAALWWLTRSFRQAMA